MPTIQTTTKTCPHCGKVYETTSYAKGTPEEERKKYGSPLRSCPFCNGRFVDKDYFEVAIEGPRKIDTKRVSFGELVFSVFAFTLGIYCLDGEGFAAGMFLIGVALFFPLNRLMTYNKRQKMIQNAMAASEERLRDPAYAATLKRLGYDVPQKYLAPDIQHNTNNR